jgi:aminoglycoside phosphotransferase (APT) family kinase protein
VSGEAAAAQAASRVAAGLGYSVTRLERMATGLCHHVFEAHLAGGGSVVIRLGRRETARAMRGGIGWHPRLAAAGVPVPALLHFSLDDEQPWMVLERLPGRDLVFEAPRMSEEQLRSLAREIAHVQRRVAALPAARGYGFAAGYDDASLRGSWRDVVVQGLERSRRRLDSSGGDAGMVDAVAARLVAFERYLGRVAPTPFLDDTTTKNVIVHQGRLSGIVDTDYVCFGDPLYALGLTRMAFLSEGLGTSYADAWAEALDLDEAARAAVELYAAAFCVDFASELGQRFNRDEPLAADAGRAARLRRILEEQLARLDELAGALP